MIRNVQTTTASSAMQRVSNPLPRGYLIQGAGPDSGSAHGHVAVRSSLSRKPKGRRSVIVRARSARHSAGLISLARRHTARRVARLAVVERGSSAAVVTPLVRS